MSSCPTGTTGPHDTSCSVPRIAGDRGLPRCVLRKATARGGGPARSLASGPSQRHPLPAHQHPQQAPLVRIAVEPSGRNDLRKPSHLMVYKLFTVPIQAVGEVLGQLEPQVLVDLDLALRG